MPEPTQNSKLSIQHVLAPALLLILLFGVLLRGIDDRYLRPDEGHSFESTSGSAWDVIQAQARDVHAPAYFLVLYAWERVVGDDDEYTARLLSALISLLTLALTYRLGRRWFGGMWPGLATLLAAGLSAYFFAYALEIRPYPLLMLTGAFSMTLFDRWLEQGTPRHAVIYGVGVALMLWTHYFGALLAGLQGLYVLAGKDTRRQWRQGFLAAGVALGLWLPWLPVFVAQVRHEGQIAAEASGLALGKAGSALPTTPETVGRFVALATNDQPVLVVLILLAGAVLLWRERRWWLAAMWAVGMPLLVFPVNLVVPIYDPRYLSPLAPGLGLWMGAGLAALIGRAPGRWKRVGQGIALVALALVLWPGIALGAPDEYPLRAYLRQLEDAFRPGDILYFDRAGFGGVLTYQYRRYAPWAIDRIYAADPATSDPNSPLIQPLAPADLPRCFWFVTSNWFEPGVQERFRALEAGHPVLQVIGEDDRYLFQRMCAPPLERPQRFGDVLRFWGAEVDLPEGDRITLRLWWDVTEAPAADYSFGLYLLDAAGGMQAQRDGPLQDYWGRGVIQTSQLQPGRYYIDLRDLVVPSDLPPGRYTLALAVYQPWDGVRLSAPDGALDGALPLESLTLE